MVNFNTSYKALEVLSVELKSIEEEKVGKIFQHQKSQESLKLQSGLKEQKDAMKEEQKKQIQQMKDYHKSFIDKLKAEFKAEV
jgi:hypothetical protein